MHSLIDSTLYCIFIRNFGGTFQNVESEIPRLKELGVRLIWLMPIHPIGVVERKGSLGSPYAISDYRAVNPEFGTLEDFIHLCDTIHKNGMRVLIDVVYNHTSPDSVLAKQHPEWFHRAPDGSFLNRVAEWTDIIDLDYTQPGLWDYQIETLKYWAQYVDGFRCDVAPLVPLTFWKRARAEVETVRPGCIWLAESVSPDFVSWGRDNGIHVLSDGELYQAFDVCYDYDVYDDYLRYIKGECSLRAYLDSLAHQKSTLPLDAVKLRFLENHDRARSAFLFPDPSVRENWLCWMFFQQGLPMLYCGQEWAVSHRPTLFDPDPVQKQGEPCDKKLIQKLISLKACGLFSQGVFHTEAKANDLVLASRVLDDSILLGVFSLKGSDGILSVPLEDGMYDNLLDGSPVPVECGMLRFDGSPVLIQAAR